MYVQHRMAERVGELRDLLQRDDTVLYICGLKGMEDGIDAMFEGGPDARGGQGPRSRPCVRRDESGSRPTESPDPTRLCVACPCGGRAKTVRPMLGWVGSQ